MSGFPAILSPNGNATVVQQSWQTSPYFQNVSAQWHFNGDYVDTGPLNLQTTQSYAVFFSTQVAPITGSVWSAQFAGTGRITSSNNNAFIFSSGQPFQIQFWLKTTNGADQNLFGQYDVNNGSGWKVMIQALGSRIHFLYENHDVSHFTNVEDGNWHFVNVVCSGTTISIVVDGAPSTPLPISGAITTNVPFIIGMGNNTDAPYAGWLDEIRIIKGTNVGGLTDIQTTQWPDQPTNPIINTVIS